MALLRNFTAFDDLFVGDDIAIEFEVFQDDLVVQEAEDGNGEPFQQYVSGTPEDVASWTFSFQVRVSDKTNAAPVLSKTTAAGITITGTYNASHASNTQRVVVAIADTDTFSDAGAVLVPPKKYRYSLKRTNAGSEKQVAYGDFVLRELPVRA